ncbi:hypothetical protein BDE40_2730 [Litoreibacter halocynthiae]|uniref:Uncharacterized protein n=1 Tax=Litoreibacter halocynthiae TaxID=1242689 RepID=A0A4R7LHW5_9RHOB|nr:hypothetical protein [Litoreibacter halocynthiae]TDT73951.1 hypothetical protein BDE40_2730 [Litoreibacter halocynthiae]
MTLVWAALLHLHYVTAFIFAALYYCLRITRDYRLRVRLYMATEGLDADALYAQFRHAMWIVGLYAAKPFRPVLPHRKAEVALVLATVLRERILEQSGGPLPRSYLRSRRQLLREAKRYVRAYASAGPNSN